jgi:hypothetical protein
MNLSEETLTTIEDFVLKYEIGLYETPKGVFLGSTQKWISQESEIQNEPLVKIFEEFLKLLKSLNVTLSFYHNETTRKLNLDTVVRKVGNSFVVGLQGASQRKLVSQTYKIEKA